MKSKKIGSFVAFKNFSGDYDITVNHRTYNINFTDKLFYYNTVFQARILKHFCSIYKIDVQDLKIYMYVYVKNDSDLIVFVQTLKHDVFDTYLVTL